MADERMNTGLNVMRRMPPSNIEVNLSGLLNLMPEETDELLQRVDQPLQVRLASFLAMAQLWGRAAAEPCVCRRRWWQALRMSDDPGHIAVEPDDN